MHYVVIQKYLSAYPDPISFKAGDEVTVGLRDDEYVGWIRVTTNAGNGGWAPEQYINTDVNPAVALKDYQAAELNTVVGQVLDVTTILNEWAWAESSTGEKGWVPCNTIAPS